MKILIIAEKEYKPTERMLEYASFDFKKVDFDKLPKVKKGRYVDWEYLYDFAGDYDGVMAIFKGNELKGVHGAHLKYRGKYIMQIEDRGLYRKWRKKILWSLVTTRKKADAVYLSLNYVMDHEMGHALCKHYSYFDSLHAFIKLKKYREWWDYMDFPKKNILEQSHRIEWWHGKHGGQIKPKCYILHTDLGTEKSTHDVIYGTKSVSYNYYICKDGSVINYVPFGTTAWHSGVVHNPSPQAKKFFGKKNPNSISVGICYEGKGEDANTKQKEAIKQLMLDDGILPIYAHKEITDYKPQGPMNLKRDLANISDNLTWWIKILKRLKN